MRARAEIAGSPPRAPFRDHDRDRARAGAVAALAALAALAFGSSAAAGCGHGADGGSSHPPEPVVAAQHGAIGGDVVARVGHEAIPASLVAGVARARRVPPDAAARALVDDALAAEGARAKNLDAEPAVHRDVVALEARLVAERLRDQARAAGPPTDDEVRELTRRHWEKVDVGEQVQAVHAVVLHPKDAARDADAKAVAEQIASAVAGATSTEDFEKRARAVPAAGFDVRVERLPPFVEDGSVADGSGSRMDAAFAKATFALRRAPGETTREPVSSSFGWHVIRVVAALPPVHLPLEERRHLFAEEAQAMRTRRAYDALLAGLRARIPIEVASDAETLMAAAVQRPAGADGR